MVRRIRFCHTPKHGSWLNIAECELSALTRQCVDGRRFGDEEVLRSEVTAWSSDVTASQRGVEWHMTVGDARVKLASVYPKILGSCTAVGAELFSPVQKPRANAGEILNG